MWHKLMGKELRRKTEQARSRGGGITATQDHGKQTDAQENEQRKVAVDVN